MQRPKQTTLKKLVDTPWKRLLAVALLVALVVVFGIFSVGENSTAEDKPELEVVDSSDEDTTDRGLFKASSRTENVGDPTIVASGLQVPAGRKDWTVMVYMVGSDLESAYGNATKDLDEMASAGVDYSRSNVVVYAGGTKRWMSDLPSNRNSVLDLSRDAGDRVVASTSGKADMGSAGALSAFINYATRQYPAEHYALVLWDHGAGPLMGSGADENYHNDTLLLSEARAAMDGTAFGPGGNKKLDLVGFDACLMSSVEVASLWSNYTDLLVASEELEPGDGWDYSALATLNDTTDARELAASIVDAYGAYYAAAATETSNPDVTLAAYDLTRVADVTSALGSLAGKLDGRLGQGDYASLAQARGEVRTLGLSATGSRGDAYDLIDLKSLADGVSDDLPWESSDLSNALDALVVESTSNVEGLGGLSVYFPGDNETLYQASGEDVLGDIAVSDTYRAFCNDYANDWLGDSPADWSLGEVTDAGDHYELRLTDEQVDNLSGAYYTVLKRAGDSGEYLPVLENVRIRPDKDGVIKVSKDPSVICATTDDLATPTEWCFAQSESIGGTSTYRSVDTYLGTGRGLTTVGIGSSSSTDVAISVAIRDGSTEAEIRSVSADDGAAVLGGKQTVDVSNYDLVGLHHGRSLSPISRRPWSEWPNHGSVWWTYLGLEDSFGFELVPVSELTTDGGEYICQLTLDDVNGGTHPTEVVGLVQGSHDTTTVATSAGTLSFELKDDHAEVIGYEGTDESLEIPAEVEGRPVTVVQALLDSDDKTVTHVTLPDSVTAIDSYAFGNDGGTGNNSLESIDLPSGLTSIGYAAFCGSDKLASADLPDSLASIGGSAFMDTALTTVHIPSSLERLGKGAFSGIASLASFEQEGDNAVTSVRDGVLFSADGSTLLAYPGAKGTSYEVPEGTTDIAFAAFAGAPIESVTLPEGLASIGNCAFLGCAKLSTLVLPDSLESIGAWAFAVPTVYVYRMSSDYLSSEYVELNSVRLGPNVTRVGGGAFDGMKVDSFDVSADNTMFSSPGGFLCNKAGDSIVAMPEGKRGVVELPDGVTTLGYCVFAYLDSDSYYGEQTDVILPDSLYRMDASVFGTSNVGEDQTSPVFLHASQGSAAEAYAERYGLPYDNVTDPDRLSCTEETVQADVATLTFRVYADRATLIKVDELDDETANQGDEASTRLEVPSEVDGRPVTQLGYGSGQLSLPSGVDTLVIPASVTNITSRALVSVANIDLDPSSSGFRLADGALLTSDGTLLVRYVGDAESYDVPDGVEEIGAYAFHHCETLASVSLPSSVRKVDAHAFDYCTSLSEIRFSEGLEEIGEYAFQNCPVTSLAFPQSLKNIGPSAFSGNERGLDSLTLPDGLESVGRGAFGDTSITATSLTRYGGDTLGIGSALTINVNYKTNSSSAWKSSDPFGGLDVKAFSVSEDNQDLKAEGPLLLSRDGTVLYECASGYAGTVVVPDGVESIGSGALERCPLVTDIVLPESVTYLDGDMLGSYDSSTGGRTYHVTLHVPEGSIGERLALEQGIPYDNETDPEKTASRDVQVEVSGSSLDFIVYPDHAVLLSVTGSEGATPEASLAIPTDVQGVPVTQIGLGGISVGLPDEVTSLEAPGSVEVIDDNVFKDCAGLTGLTLHEGLREVGESAFQGTSLASLSLPAGLERVGDNAFNTSYDVKTDLTGLTLPESLVSIGEYAFRVSSEAGYYDLRLPDALESIGSSALDGGPSGEAVLSIGASLTSMGNMDSPYGGFFRPFGNLRVSGFSVDEGNPVFSSKGPLLLSKDGKTLYACAPGYAGKVVVPEGVETIYDGAFSNCDFLTDVVLPASVTSVDDLGLPKDYEYDYDAGTSSSTPYAMVHVPAGSAAETYLQGEGTPYDNDMNVAETRVVDVTASGVRMSFLVRDGSATLYLCSGTAHDQSDSLTIPAEVDGVPVTTVGLNGQKVGVPAFVTSLDIPASVSSIGENAFDECASLTQVTFHEGLRSIGDYAFDFCSLSSLSLPAGLESIGSSAFCNQQADCDLTNLTLPESLIAVGSHALPATSGGYHNLVLPAGLQTLGYRAFSGVFHNVWPRSRLGDATPLGEGALVIGPSLQPTQASSAPRGDAGPTNPFAGLGTTSFTVDEANESLSSTGQLLLSRDGTVLYACATLTEGEVVVPDGVEQIAAYAFEGCRSLTGIRLPDSLKTIGDGAFFGCEGLGELTVPSGVERIGAYALGSDSYRENVSLATSLHVAAGSAGEAWAQKNGIPYDVI